MVINRFTMKRSARFLFNLARSMRLPGDWRALAARTGTVPTAGRYAALGKTERTHMLGTILIVILILFLVGALPTWGHSRNWGYAPSGGLGLVLLIVLILVLTGNI